MKKSNYGKECKKKVHVGENDLIILLIHITETQ